jgi:2-polyprenyl-3-methyl-5-hydroxy-6-metoxy-1,4-benzoquinol methylase
MDKTKQVKDGFNKYAVSYQERHMEEILYTNTFDVFCDVIKKQNTVVLELGCGPGNVSKYLLSHLTDLTLFGIDLSEKMIELSKVNNPNANFEVMDCREIHLLNKTYDGIMCGFCLPYLSKEEAIQLVNDCSKLLNPKGVLYISTMEDDYCKSGWRSSGDGQHQMYMHYHQQDYLMEAITKNHMNLIELRRQDYPTTDGTKIIDLIIIAQK